MPIHCTVSHADRLVLAIARDKPRAGDLVGFLLDLDREKAQAARPIRVFAERHDARRWLDGLPGAPG